MNEAGKKYLDLEGLCKKLHLKPQTVYNMISADAIPHLKPFGKLLFDAEEIDVWVREQSKLRKEMKKKRKSKVA